MLKIEASTSAPSPARLLSPAAVLRRLRPVKLSIIADELNTYFWRYQGAQLIGLTGAKFEQVPDNWEDMLREVLRQVEAWDWFEVDWDQLNGDYDSWMQSGEEEYFNHWLTYIPVARYGISDWDESWIHECAPMALLKALLNGDWGDTILINILDEYGLQADWNVTQGDIWYRLQTADFSGYGGPLAYLPEMARIACNRTGHELLDYSNYFEDEPMVYRWDDDLETVKGLWQTAKPTVERMREFLRWCDDAAAMQMVVDALIVPPPKPKRKRKPKPKQAKIRTLVDILAPDTQETERIRIR